jgi:hypothetical protein
MNKIESIGHWILETKKPVYVACAIAIIASILLAAIVYLYVPLIMDGGWVSYPALSLSRGGDPGENQLNIEEFQNINGVKAAFGFDTRESVRVIPMSWWFRILGTSIWAVKLFGILELTVLMGLVYLLLRRISNDKHIAMLCWAIYLTDSVVIYSGSTFIRPDIMMAIMTLLVFLFSGIESNRTYAKGYRFLALILGILGMSLLALIWSTSAIPIALLISYMFSELFVSRKDLSKFTKWFYFSLIITGIVSFMMRARILDMLVPTQYTIHSAVDVKKEVYSCLAEGILPIIEKEFHRWTDYFLISNVGELLAIISGLFMFIIYLFGPSNKKSLRLCMPLGCLAAIGVLALDPHRWSVHALPVVPFFLMVLARELDVAHNTKIKYSAVSFLFILVFISAGIKVAQAGKIIIKGIHTGYNNMALVNAIDNVFNEDKNYIIVGPTELWPYIKSKTNVTIIDTTRSKNIEVLTDYLKKIDYIIINNDYEAYNWERRFRERYPDIGLKTVAEVGNTKGGWHFVKIIKPVFIR